MGFIGTLRASLRLTAVFIWTAVMYSAMLVTIAVLWPWQSARIRVQSAFIRVWGRGILRIANIHVESVGTKPTAPFIQVSNHLTYIDMVLMWAELGCAFVSRADLRDWPIMGPMSRTLNTVYINREDRRDTKRVNERIAAAYDRGLGIHIFVEGRISQDAQVAEFKAPLLEPAVAKGVPVHYAALSYRTPEHFPPAGEIVVWKKGISLGRNIFNILKLPRVYATVHYGGAPIARTDRKELARALQDAVKSAFIPLAKSD